MTNINLLTEINENIVSKGFYTVDAVKIRYYYKEVYKTELKENCKYAGVPAKFIGYNDRNHLSQL